MGIVRSLFTYCIVGNEEIWGICKVLVIRVFSEKDNDSLLMICKYDKQKQANETSQVKPSSSYFVSD